MQVVILAGGKGTRMGAATEATPKPMLRVGGKPILEHQVELARRYGFTDLRMLTAYRGGVIQDYFGNGEKWDVRIAYTQEAEPLGTAGAVKAIEHLLHGDFLVFYGDVLMDVDLVALAKHHREQQGIATLAVHPNDHPHDSDLVEVDSTGKVTAIHPKPHPPGADRRNLVSAALYVLSPAALAGVPTDHPSDFGRDIFPHLAAAGSRITAYQTREYIKDVGTGRRLQQVEADLEAGRPARFNRQHALGAVFLDRDGVLNQEAKDLRTPDSLKLYPGVPVAVAELNRSDRLAVVVTNQPDVAKGFLSEPELDGVHARLEALLGVESAYLDRIYHCPHHPERGHAGERVEYKIECACRKPNTGMIECAARDLNVDLTDSFMIGDRTVDIQAGLNAGITTILVRTGAAGKDCLYACEPDFICEDLVEAVRFVNHRYPHLLRVADELLATHSVTGNGRTAIVVAGLSRSGKSTLASTLALALKRRGRVARPLRLDHWLLDVEDRRPDMTVRSRYRYSDIDAAVQRLLAGERIEFNRYDAAARRRIGTVSMALGPADVLVIDGVVGLDIPAVRERAALRLFTEVDEAVRRERFVAFYRFKGLEPDAIARLYQERQGEETPIIEGSRKYADRVVNLEMIA